VSDAFWLIAIVTVLSAAFAVGGWWIDRKLERERDVLPPPCRSTERPGSVAEFRRRMAARRYVA
jgi:hypothetical protein